MASILIIDDDPMLCDMLCRHFGSLGHDTAHALSLRKGLAKASQGDFDVVFLDVGLPDGDGLEALPEIRALPCSPEVIIFTAEGNPEGAELAIHCGAWDYIEKPPSVHRMNLPLARALQYRAERKRKAGPAALRRDAIIGGSPRIQQGLDLLAEAAACDANVLITGETGTGKELFASAIHENSRRSASGFVVVDCAALPTTLVESVLFGHVKGAFTGADRSRPGLVLQAHRGTLFLDEVGELPLRAQKTFLRVLQERRFRPVGDSVERESDFRLVAATNRDLGRRVREGRFREDLLFRLRSLTIEVPPLRERKEDIKDLAAHFIHKLAGRQGTPPKGFTPEFLEALQAHDWPGNVRELASAVETAVSLARNEPTLFALHLPARIRLGLTRSALRAGTGRPGARPNPVEAGEGFPTLRRLMESTERQYLQRVLASTGGSVKDACRISGLSRSRLYERMKKYGIPRLSGVLHPTA